MKNSIRSLVIGAILSLGLTAFAQTAATPANTSKPTGVGDHIANATAVPASTMASAQQTFDLLFPQDQSFAGREVNIALMPQTDPASALQMVNARFTNQNRVYTLLSDADGKALLSKHDAMIQERLQKIGDAAKRYTAFAIAKSTETSNKIAMIGSKPSATPAATATVASSGASSGGNK